MTILIIMKAAKLLRFAKEVWHETQRLRRTFPDPAGE